MDEAAHPLHDALELLRKAPADLWPGFAPATIPTLVFDGERTSLSGATPEGAGWQAAPHVWT
ncbi:hypothetical protein [Deinococcus frigens]|uniref:hypothetical protein n=1 Tax=Deinococcus frigens TaxID=249403 RepID=UPI0004967E0A|nr:hypothetical protein [Deinococcus frigens]